MGILPLVDIGTSSFFIRKVIVKKLGPMDRVQLCHQDVRYGNGEMEAMQGVVTLLVKFQGKDMLMQAYVL